MHTLYIYIIKKERESWPLWGVNWCLFLCPKPLFVWPFFLKNVRKLSVPFELPEAVVSVIFVKVFHCQVLTSETLS